MLLREKKEIEDWLDKYDIDNYELIEDKEYGYVVNVNRDVNLYNRNLKSIDIKFNEIKGNFNCAWNLLTTLEGCPEVIQGSFIIYNNELEIQGLKYLPNKIENNFIKIYNNEKLGDLENITNFKELKEKLNIYFEKENLLKSINKEDLNKNNSINKI